MSDELVTIKQYPNYLEAELVKGRLESEGIFCNLFGAISNTIYPRFPTIRRGVSLQVPREVAERALSLIQEWENSVVDSSDTGSKPGRIRKHGDMKRLQEESRRCETRRRIIIVCYVTVITVLIALHHYLTRFN